MSTFVDWSSIKDLGEVPDAIIADRFGITKEAVYYARKSRGITAWRSRIDPKLVSKRCIFRGYINSARRRGIPFLLSEEQFFSLIDKPCRYCGIQPFNQYNYTLSNKVKLRQDAEIKYNGIDRLDPDKPYEISNCSPCCMICNYAKSDYSYAEFMEYISRLVKHNSLNGAFDGAI